MQNKGRSISGKNHNKTQSSEDHADVMTGKAPPWCTRANYISFVDIHVSVHVILVSSCVSSKKEKKKRKKEKEKKEKKGKGKKEEKKGEKKKVYSTRYSQAVTHPSTNLARRCLTSVIGREPVFSTWYGRRH